MRALEADTITQAVIAHHAAAPDARLRELMNSLVQHLHTFAREVRLTEAEWLEGLRFLVDCGRLSGPQRHELALLSGALGLTTLVAAQNRRGPQGGIEAAMPAALGDALCRHAAPAGGTEPCFVRGCVRTPEGRAIAAARVEAWPADGNGARADLVCDGDGGFLFKGLTAEAAPIPQDGPVGRLLALLGRHPWRPAHLHFSIHANGHARVDTHLFRAGDPYLGSDALFGVRRALVAEWVRHDPGPAPDGQPCATPFHTVDFVFVLPPLPGAEPSTTTQGDKR